jgi:general secretion pathway protein G
MRFRNSHRGKHLKRGFTLMEVLLVLAILVILGGTATFFFAGVQTNANKRAALTQINATKAFLDTYRIDVGQYPQSLDDLYTLPADLANPNKWGGPYTNKPIPPDPWDNPYNYEVQGDQYRVWSLGPDGADNTEDDITSDQ